MKRNCTLLIILLVISYPLTAQKHKADSVNITIHLNNIANNKDQVDSVYLIFDRYDLTAAGLVKKVYYPLGNKILVEDLPKGRYYIDIYCLGKYVGHFSRVAMIHPKASSDLTFRLKRQDHYQVGMPYIPEEKIDFTRLAIIIGR